MEDRPATSLKLNRIQGNVAPGFRKDFQATVLARFAERVKLRAWLAERLVEVTGGQEVRDFADERDRLGDSYRITGTWLSVAFSRQGLEMLGVDEIDRFPSDFHDGLYARAADLGDGPIEGRSWKAGGSEKTEAHALLILAADTLDDLKHDVSRHQERLSFYGVHRSAMHADVGERLDGAGGARRHHEHFGFRDGISQPVIDPTKLTDPKTLPEEVVAPGEFVLGHPDTDGVRGPVEPAWARDGSFLVFRRLKQDVAAWRRMLDREAEHRPLETDQLAAKLVGRWPSGAKLDRPIQALDPGPPKDMEVPLGRAELLADPSGDRLPRPAHIRKAHPRDLGPGGDNDPRRHRLIRRAIPYGPPLPRGVKVDDHVDRGLLFLAYQASIERQFEFIHKAWFNAPSFPRDGDGVDPILGRGEGGRKVRFPESGGDISLDQFVTVTGGGYFFTPSMRALGYLADPERGWNEEEIHVPYPSNVSNSSDDPARALGELILEEMPYPRAELVSPLRENPDPEAVRIEGVLRHRIRSSELDAATLKRELGSVLDSDYWYFECRPRRVTKMVRIEFEYTVDGHTYTEHILVGFEGMGP